MNEAIDHERLQPASPCTGLRLLCLLVRTRNGETRSLPVHTLRPMPPRLCAANSHAANGRVGVTLCRGIRIRPLQVCYQ
ncbi:hypothetical protein L3N39_07070 [Pseudomonas sp. JM10B5a]|nr:hypothetical protein [Pseudomonas oligotrophica]MCF7201843.1 hypothetical protein [Pseudomonas oligotrophica]